MIIIIAVVLTSIYIFIISSEEDDTDIPSRRINWRKNPEIPGNYVGNIDDIESTLLLEDITITATHGGNSDSEDLDVLAKETQMNVGNMTLDFIDLEPFGKLGNNDIFIIYGGKTGDITRLVYKPTSGSMVGYPLP
ncbi:MAG: hypothetical protein JSV09_07950 [Thermoplasmata archaeon]|nr:MAG: hypothetical protein JSV09_07950 [Thermoplasmata archaeon]